MGTSGSAISPSQNDERRNEGEINLTKPVGLEDSG